MMKFIARFQIGGSASDLTAQDPLRRETSPRPGTETSVATSINSKTPKL